MSATSVGSAQPASGDLAAPLGHLLGGASRRAHLGQHVPRADAVDRDAVRAELLARAPA